MTQNNYSIVIQLNSKQQAASAYKTFITGDIGISKRQPFNLISKHYSSKKIQDCRYSNIYIQMEDSSRQAQRDSDPMLPTRGENGNRSGSNSTKDTDLIVSQYIGDGIIRLFRNINSIDTDYEAKSSLNESTPVLEEDDNMSVVRGDGTMLAILFIPIYFTVHELLHYYIGDDIINHEISYFRILKNKSVNKFGYNFMVLIKFKFKEAAKKFMNKFNGQKFSKMDPETCHVVEIAKIVFVNNLFSDTNTKDFPFLLTDPFTNPKPNPNSNSNNNINTSLELPSCPVCLERMDSSITGLITIPCQHTFHCQCLNKWKNSKCPICRFSTLRISRDLVINKKQVNIKDSNHCLVCNSLDNLWICLICGNIGCGRYNLKHAIEHYEKTSHCFAMDMKTQRVWDYSSDNYVHRLVQNEVDGKLVEVTANASNNDNDELTTLLNSTTRNRQLQDFSRNHQTNGNSLITSIHQTSALSTENSTSSNVTDDNNDEFDKSSSKDYNMIHNFMRNREYHLEYVQVLISQLESQREYYELKLETQNLEIKKMNENNQNKNQIEIEKLNSKLNDLNTKLSNTSNIIEKQNHDIDEKNLMIKGLQENLDSQTKKNTNLEKLVNQLQAENRDLTEQTKDLMFFLDSQQKFANESDEVKNGTIVIQQNPQPSSSNTTKSNKKKKIKKKIK
ncbi:hypothetical protein TBLA_0G02310 [Henningerozyma blattae CBS 6284]|uniref:RING-type domain-containing protein n=1 Tax=Henningerozyma blattae (strain ATCC 34711 / CBS 6284 / DSM 70876 / NBRC 10599 / NRRL Y-10934 / UCD 77-7) TaxID=1071380 RepID=I2H719_HENB6|nr:hypothetical protein TBLA_0G02310 [Tetrapisispora blattae CBS 6284]CCH62171.1 hypothetical protein TBLA_0G02310 [Tetrapisispora blattae CBS 6284]